MLSQKSLRAKFALQLASASTMLIVIFSVMLYHYIKITIFENIVQSLTIEAKNISAKPEIINLEYKDSKSFDLIKIVPNDDNLTRAEFVSTKDDNATYLGNQLECEFGGDRCFGIAANMDFLLVCTYEENGENPELVIYKKR